MTQNSRFWNGTTVGDASEAPYDAPDEFAAVLRSLNGANANSHRSGVCRGELNELAVTAAGGVSPISVNTGRAFVHGTWFENDAAASFNIDATPATQSRIDLVVLRKTWATQQVRLAILKGTDAVVPVAPTPTQSAGVTWEFPIYQITIVPAGTLTIDDVRQYVPYLSAQIFDKIAEITLAAPDDIVSFDITGETYRLYLLVINSQVEVGTTERVAVYFTPTTANEYAWTIFQTFGTPPVSTAATASAATWYIMGGRTGEAGTNKWPLSILLISNLHDSGKYKEVLGLVAIDDYIATANVGIISGRWDNTSAVTAINIALDAVGDSFEIGSKFTLYGIQ